MQGNPVLPLLEECRRTPTNATMRSKDPDPIMLLGAPLILMGEEWYDTPQVKPHLKDLVLWVQRIVAAPKGVQYLLHGLPRSRADKVPPKPPRIKQPLDPATQSDKGKVLQISFPQGGILNLNRRDVVVLCKDAVTSFLCIVDRYLCKFPQDSGSLRVGLHLLLGKLYDIAAWGLGTAFTSRSCLCKLDHAVQVHCSACSSLHRLRNQCQTHHHAQSPNDSTTPIGASKNSMARHLCTISQLRKI